MSVSDQGSSGLPGASIEELSSVKTNEGEQNAVARRNLEQMIIDALETADEETLTTMIGSKRSLIIERKESPSASDATEHAQIAGEEKSRCRLVSQEFVSENYFGSVEDTAAASMREIQKKKTLSKFRPVNIPTAAGASTFEPKPLGRVKMSTNEYLEKLGRKPSAEQNAAETLDEHDEDWALRESKKSHSY